MAAQARRDFIEGEIELRARARDLVRALTDREIQFLPRRTGVVGSNIDWAEVTAEVEKDEA